MLKGALLIAALAGTLIWGITHLFLLRFQTGDVYPPYSSLRTDPLGTKALHDALHELPALDVRRNYRPIGKLRPAVPATLLYIGTPHGAFWGDQELRDVGALLNEGSRVVISFLPRSRALTKHETKRSEEEEARLKNERLEREKETADPEKPATEKDHKEEEEEKPIIAFDEVAKRWGFAFRFLADPPSKALLQDGAGALEPALSWHTSLYFELQDPAWRTLYTSDDQPVVVERPMGKGSIVLVADSFLLSNEAMREDRRTALLGWLIGTSPMVVFDEESHGVREEPGIVSLVRKYGLQGVVAGLLALAILFIWKNATPLVPPLEDLETAADTVIGKKAGEGFVNLLRRSIAPREILRVCAQEWRKSFDHEGRTGKSAHVERVLATEEAKPARQRDPLAAYRTIAEALSKR